MWQWHSRQRPNISTNDQPQEHTTTATVEINPKEMKTKKLIIQPKTKFITNIFALIMIDHLKNFGHNILFLFHVCVLIFVVLYHCG